jgi:predicted GH43/DUF377 family glycosyl hydrolase
LRLREFILIAALLIPTLSLTISVAQADTTTYSFNGSVEKFAGNPILTPTAGSWDAQFVLSPRVIHDSIYRMWYTGGSTGITGIGYATSNDGFSWTKHSGPVLSPGASGSWDSGEVQLGSVIWNGSLYVMWYRGGNTISDNGAVGLATSPDGITWTKYVGNPVLVSAAFGLDQRYLATPFTIKMALSYNMWYTGQSGVTASSNPSSSILYATSYDGKSWNKWASAVFSPSSDANAWDSGSVYAPATTFDGTNFEMWYSAMNRSYTRPQIGFASSADGSTWTRSSTSPLLSPGGAGSWDSQGVEQPDVVAFGSGFLLYYDGFSESTGGRIGVASGPLGTPIPEFPYLSFNLLLGITICGALASIATMKRRQHRN